jgi:hypothetical protein
MDSELNDMTSDELRRRFDELARDFRERHPAKSRASEFVNNLVKAARSGPGLSRSDRERERAGEELFVRYYAFCTLFEPASLELEEEIFDLLLKIIRRSHELGVHAAPDGVAARAARSDRAQSDFVMLVQVVGIYLEASGLEPKASLKFASKIRPDLLDAMELPKVACSPSLSAIVKALRAIRLQTLDI